MALLDAAWMCHSVSPQLLGLSALQCRQKTVETKAKCKNAKCTLYWCPRCLLNRYGEEVEEVKHW